MAIIPTASGIGWPLVGGLVLLLAFNGLCVDCGHDVVVDDGDTCGRRDLLKGVV